eukprot:1278910-Amphidinium_carterae.1
MSKGAPRSYEAGVGGLHKLCLDNKDQPQGQKQCKVLDVIHSIYQKYILPKCTATPCRTT